MHATHTLGAPIVTRCCLLLLLLPQVLLTPVGRLKVCGLGVAEALTGEVVPANSEVLLALQREDVVVSGVLFLFTIYKCNKLTAASAEVHCKSAAL
jgi:hypothetical protein